MSATSVRNLLKEAWSLVLLALMVSSFPASGQNIAYPFEVAISGKGSRAILFIPGFGCAGAVWDETKAVFEKEFTCYTLTMAGFAGVKPQPNPTFRGWETGIAMYIRNHSIQQPILVGHSLGGALALAIAADYPDLVSRIVVVDALPCLAALTYPAFASMEDNDCSERITQMTSMSEGQFYQSQKRTIKQMLADTSRIATVIDWSVKSDRTTFGGMFCDFSNTDLRERLGSIKCPSLILLERYFAFYKPAIRSQYRKLATADLRYATRGQHFIMYDDLEWYRQQLNSFIQN